MVRSLISKEKIRDKICEIARVLDAMYRGEEVTVVIVMKSALCLGADLIREMKTSIVLEYVRASSYGQRGKERSRLRIVGMEDLELAAKHVLLVDDIFDSGETLSQIAAQLKDKHPKTLKSLVLLAKKIERTTSYFPDYVLFEIEDDFVVGYGLDYKELYRGFPEIGILDPEDL